MKTPEDIAERARRRQSTGRYRMLSMLFRKDGASRRLLAIARNIRAQLSSKEALAATTGELVARTRVLRAEIETLLMHASARRKSTHALVCALTYSVRDLRDASWRSKEGGARAVEDQDARGSIAARAFAPGQLVEEMERDGNSSIAVEVPLPATTPAKPVAMRPSPKALKERARFWRSASRYRQLATLFTENGASNRLRAISDSIEMELANGEAMSALAQQMISRSRVLCAEVDTLLMRVRARREGAPFYLSPPLYSVDDMREEARLCLEEAGATDHPETKRSIAAGALSLAQLAEAVERDRSPMRPGKMEHDKETS